ncbi:MAG TPA: UbiA family prenyltransferase [Xanthobacteraceae bacterium]|nr:UbiA family prenyltransferase [Xanthobacteraceae bacterium]
MPDAITPSRRDLWIHWLVYPGHSLPTAAAPVLVAMGLAIHDHVFALTPALLAFVASWLIHIAGLIADNYQLLVRYPTVNEHPELIAALDSGTVTCNGMRRAMVACLVLSALTGPYFLTIAGMPAIAIGLVGIAGSFGYSSGPLPYGKHGLADPIFFVMFGVVAPAAAYYVQLAWHHEAVSGWQLLLHDLPLRALIVGLPLGAFAVNILIIDDIRDRSFDAAKGWRTGPIRFGLGFSRVEYLLVLGFAYLVPFWFWQRWQFDAWVLLPLATLPFAGAIARKVWTDDGHDALVPMTPLAAVLCLAYAVLLAVGIAL